MSPMGLKMIKKIGNFVQIYQFNQQFLKFCLTVTQDKHIVYLGLQLLQYEMLLDWELSKWLSFSWLSILGGLNADTNFGKI